MGGRDTDIVLLDENGIRSDGRKVNETRKVTIKAGVLKNAKKMIYSGESVKSKDALKMGLIDELCKSTGINRSGLDLMDSCNLSSRNAIKAAKTSINEGIDLDIKSSLNIEFREYIKTLDTEERKEALKKYSSS